MKRNLILILFFIVSTYSMTFAQVSSTQYKIMCKHIVDTLNLAHTYVSDSLRVSDELGMFLYDEHLPDSINFYYMFSKQKAIYSATLHDNFADNCINDNSANYFNIIYFSIPHNNYISANVYIHTDNRKDGYPLWGCYEELHCFIFQIIDEDVKLLYHFQIYEM